MIYQYSLLRNCRFALPAATATQETLHGVMAARGSYASGPRTRNQAASLPPSSRKAADMSSFALPAAGPGAYRSMYTRPSMFPERPDSRAFLRQYTLRANNTQRMILSRTIRPLAVMCLHGRSDDRPFGNVLEATLRAQYSGVWPDGVGRRGRITCRALVDYCGRRLRSLIKR